MPNSWKIVFNFFERGKILSKRSKEYLFDRIFLIHRNKFFRFCMEKTKNRFLLFLQAKQILFYLQNFASNILLHFGKLISIKTLIIS